MYARFPPKKDIIFFLVFANCNLVLGSFPTVPKPEICINIRHLFPFWGNAF